MKNILNFKYNLIMGYILFFTPFMVMASNSLFGMWINLELNMMSFLGVMILNNINIYDYSLKYFLINSFSSSIFLIMFNLNIYCQTDYCKLIMSVAIFMKMGVFPFTSWFIDLMMNLNWFTCFLLSTWQKLIPFYILINFINENFFYLVVLVNSFMSVVCGIGQVNLKKIMGYSSVNHMSWMLVVLLINNNLWIYYFFFYFLINMSIMYLLNILKIVSMTDMYMYMNNKFKYYLMFLFLSLGGLPPFFGFTLKWFSMVNMILVKNYLILLFLLIFSLIYLYYYIRLIFMFMIMNHYSLKFFYSVRLNLDYLNKNSKLFNFLNVLMIINLMVVMFWFIY